jgi:putative membrane protein
MIFAALAALLHVYIFWMESLRWERAETRRVFGTTPEQAATTRQLAFNQGFYNLFLAITAIAGIVLFGWPVVSNTLLIVALGSMLLAALVLVANDRSRVRAALVQGLFPALGLVFLALSLNG